MAETKRGAESPSTGGQPVRILGRWPIINLIVAEEEDLGYSLMAAEGGEAHGSAAESKAGDVNAMTSNYILSIHTSIPLKFQNNYAAVRQALRGRNKQGRKAAHALLVDRGLLADGSDMGRAMVAAALEDVRSWVRDS